MNRQEKEAAVAELKQTLDHVTSLVVTQFDGLTVEEEGGLRREMREAQCHYRVVKNTLFKLAVVGTPMEKLSPIFKGTSAIAFSYSDPVGPAKVIDRFTSKSGHLRVKGGFLDGQVLGAEKVKSLATMKGTDELRAELLATFIAPAEGFVRLLAAALQSFVYLLKARERALERE